MEDNIMVTQEPEQTPLNEAAIGEIDRRVQQAVARAREQWQADADRAEAERAQMAAMTDEQRADYALTQRENALAERERRLMERELRAMALEKLAQRGLPGELADALNYTGEAACLNSLDALEKVFRSAVQKSVDERLRGAAPSAGSGRSTDVDGLSDADYYRATVR